MDIMISMNTIRRAGLFIAAAAVVPFAALAATGCGGAPTATGTGSHGQRIGFSDYGANFHITAPRTAIPAR